MQSHQDITIEPCLMAQRQTDGGFPWEAGLPQVQLVEPHLFWSEGPVQAAVPCWSLILVPPLVLEMEMFTCIWKMPLWTDWCLTSSHPSSLPLHHSGFWVQLFLICKIWRIDYVALIPSPGPSSVFALVFPVGLLHDIHCLSSQKDHFSSVHMEYLNLFWEVKLNS